MAFINKSSAALGAKCCGRRCGVELMKTACIDVSAELGEQCVWLEY